MRFVNIEYKFLNVSILVLLKGGYLIIITEVVPTNPKLQ